MALILNTNIQRQLNEKVRGRIARIGGSVNQLLSYDNCTVEDFNMFDGGFGKIRTGWKSVLSPRKFIKEEWRFYKEGWKIPRGRKTRIIDMHYAYREKALFGRYDAVVTSNVIEHSPNPVWFLLNLYYIGKPKGYQYHAIPHYQYTYDIHRIPTTLEHIILDFETFTGQNDTTHTQDYVQSAIDKHGWQREFHKKYPLIYPYIHFHVFDESNTRSLFEFIFEEVENDVIRTNEFGDNIVLFRNILKSSFINRYGKLIAKYQQDYDF